MLVEVWDSSDEMPVSKPMAELSLEDVLPDAESLNAGHEDGMSGRGLPIVEALAVECGVTETAPAGKWVWARIAD
ncbi:hypothetical protein E1293_27050 [Actinomadura darangshiensis]|uniref:Uncharacterized protein n=1 Tax=Actinomadura darangshiensis TaxID=705336 RepID=A0A4V2YUB0_9ACTN|nr:hypothetical protein [Actinomadura darangshiensis]TDD76567.1 hypothetical protein E1293_27050 [Actinomadura darangshiensis]